MSELQKITERNLVASPFLNQLPGDVRNLIYEFVLGGNTWDFTRNGTLINHVAKADRNDHRALLRVCRQIYNETRVLPWSLCIFSCHGLKQVRLWAAKFPPVYRRAIKSIILKIGMEDSAPTVSKEVLEQTWGSRVEIGAQDFPKLTSLRVHIKDPNNGGKHGQHLYGRLGVQECYRVADGAGDVHLSMELVEYGFPN